MRTPTVSFVVPCYKLAHLLPQCVSSILSQSYKDFEVLIMNDRSPDNTAEVAQSFNDPRVKHILNDENLGHLRNYNRGISLSTGKYVWLLSADDYLRQPLVLERYVNVMERHPNVGYAFCPGYGVRGGAETTVMGRYSERRDRDRIFRGTTLLRRLARSNFVLTPSVMVRRRCYETIGLYDLSMPWCGDWYLWCLFALHCQVAYFAEPMVCYRDHDLSMTTHMVGKRLDACAAEEITVAWGVREEARRAGFAEAEKQCFAAIARTYGRILASERYRTSSWFMKFDKFEASVSENATSEAERDYLRAHVSMSVGNEYYWQGNLALARKFYAAALQANPWIVTAYLKNLLLALGKPGEYLRKTILAFR